MKSFAIVGSGAVGSYYGGRLAKAGNEVNFLLRADYEAVKENGLRVESVDGDFFLPEVRCARSSEEIGPVDVVIVAWKATANQHAKEVITPLLHDNTIILTLQNGLGNIEYLGGLFGIERMMGAMCFVCINRIGPGLIRHTAGGLIGMGEGQGGPTGRLQELAELFGEAEIKCDVSPNFTQTQWRKLVWNIPFNGFCIAEGGVDTETLLAHPDGPAKVKAVMEEVAAASGALGFPIDDDFVEFQLTRTYRMGDYKPSSMLDYINGLPVEVDSIWGEPLRQAREAGVDTPLLAELESKIRRMVNERAAV